MPDPLVLNIPQDISERAQQIAALTQQPVERVLLEHLKTLLPAVPALPVELQAELDALRYLSDDALWTIAREQMPDDVQARATMLMAKNQALTESESDELAQLVERADRLMLRKSEAAALLKARGHAFTQQDFKGEHG